MSCAEAATPGTPQMHTYPTPIYTFDTIKPTAAPLTDDKTQRQNAQQYNAKHICQIHNAAVGRTTEVSRRSSARLTTSLSITTSLSVTFMVVLAFTSGDTQRAMLARFQINYTWVMNELELDANILETWSKFRLCDVREHSNLKFEWRTAKLNE